MRAEEAVGRFLAHLSLPEDWQEQVRARVQGRKAELRDIAREKAKLERQWKAFQLEHRLGDITDNEYKSERDRIKLQLGALTPPALLNLEPRAAMLKDFGRVWAGASSNERKQLIPMLLKVVCLDADSGPVAEIEHNPKDGIQFYLARIWRSAEQRPG